MAETLSPTFVGMTFGQVFFASALYNNDVIYNKHEILYMNIFLKILQVATICYTKLNLCLLAIEQRKFEGGDIFINPKDKIINPNAIGKFGYFFLQMDEEIEFASFNLI